MKARIIGRNKDIELMDNIIRVALSRRYLCFTREDDIHPIMFNIEDIKDGTDDFEIFLIEEDE